MDDETRSRIEALEQCVSERIAEFHSMQKELEALKAKPKQSKPPISKIRKQRRLSDKWITVLQFIGEHPATDYEEIMEFIKDNGLPISRNSFRGQICHYTRKEWIEKNPRHDFISLTEAGIEICGYRSRHKTESPSVFLWNDSEEIPF